jgi:hypothetical protein
MIDIEAVAGRAVVILSVLSINCLNVGRHEPAPKHHLLGTLTKTGPSSPGFGT